MREMFMNVLILGVGPPQRDAIEYLKDRNHTVHAISYHAEPVGSTYPDYFSITDIKDKPGVERYVGDHYIDILYSVGSDIAMPTVAYVSLRCGLPFFVSESLNEMMRVKSLFRNFQASNHGMPVSYRILSRLEDAKGWKEFPAVIKPLDSQGQRGVFKVNSQHEIEKTFSLSAEYSKQRQAIIETHVEGQEYSANVYVVNSCVRFCFFSSRIAGVTTPFGTVSAHLLPAQLEKNIYSSTVTQIENAIQRLGIENGPVYVQFKLLGQKMFIIEIAPRLDGCHLWRAIHFSTGIDLLDISFRHLMGEDPTEDLSNNDPIRPVKLEFFFQPPHTLFSSSNHSVDAEALFLQFYYSDGNLVTPVNGTLEKVGYQIRPCESY